MIKFYNTKTQQIENFQPIRPGHVDMYICGPTVYNDLHIGNGRPIVTFDLLNRYLKYRGFKVKHVSNITDVDDKIINFAHEKNITEAELVKDMTNRYFTVLNELNINQDIIMPKATEYIKEMIEYINDLIKKDYAYVKEGDVYFRTKKLKSYGSLSHINPQEQEEHSRIEINDHKEDDLDFTLWKKTDQGINWSAFDQLGRPGWHTECVVMINEIFKGQKIDIHGGGIDLRFPHHENELAQCEAHSNHELANIWMHNGFININGDKMSKSLNNFITIKQFLNEYDANTFKMIMYMTHYRSPINIHEDLIKSAQNNLNKIKNIMTRDDLDWENNDEVMLEYEQKFIKAMDYDLGTADGLTVIFEIIKEINKNHITKIKNFKIIIEQVLGLVFHEEIIDKSILDKFEKYKLAKLNKNYNESDAIREELKIAGYQVIDGRDQITIKKV